ncbi:hypothetical protein GGI23_007592, partial [Coemansia sp. RSA 2559]
MADAALSAGGMSARHREHLPKQQPQQPLRPAMASTHLGNTKDIVRNSSSSSRNNSNNNDADGTQQAPHREHTVQTRVRPMSFSNSREVGGG